MTEKKGVKYLLDGLRLKFVSVVNRGANQFADVVLLKSDEPVKTEDGQEFHAGDYAYTPDKKLSSTWKLRLTSTPGADPDAQTVGAAVAALGEGFRGNKVEIPSEDRGAVVERVRQAWLKANPEKSKEDLPPVLKADPSEEPMTAEDQKKFDELSASVKLADSISTLTAKAAMSKNVADLDAVSTEIGKMEGEAAKDPRVIALKDMIGGRKTEMAKAESDQQYEQFKASLPKNVQDAFDAMSADEKMKFMDACGKSFGSEKDPIGKALAPVLLENEQMKKRLESIETEGQVATLKAELGGTEQAETSARTIVRLRATDKEAADSLLKQLKDAQTALKAAGLFKEVGKAGEGEGAADQLDTMAKARAAKDGITFAKAYSLVMTENPELYSKSASQGGK